MANEERPSFADAIKVDKLDSHNYKANLNAAFSIGAGTSIRWHRPGPCFLG
ncbi:hypothetical protein J3459_014261 [Metarhizium acridum]|uniref:uncharacterized protein n=1 Tax=Metarhizium acridum TaxID=92637 RepID=UPI001C6CD3E0|nr:hypothetical protein J3459_014261 [Metarhizium acridum]KAG8416325.1 hypothetical protein J3458_006917 [Metarhizium acridum]